MIVVTTFTPIFGNFFTSLLYNKSLEILPFLGVLVITNQVLFHMIVDPLNGDNHSIICDSISSEIASFILSSQ